MRKMKIRMREPVRLPTVMTMEEIRTLLAAMPPVV